MAGGKVGIGVGDTAQGDGSAMFVNQPHGQPIDGSRNCICSIFPLSAKKVLQERRPVIAATKPSLLRETVAFK